MARIKTLEEELKDNPELKEEDVKALREWVKTQPHLPNIDVSKYLQVINHHLRTP